MEGGAVDALLLTGYDSLRSVELGLRNISCCKMMTRKGMIPDESRIEAVQEQQLVKCSSSRPWCREPKIRVRAPLRAPLLL